MHIDKNKPFTDMLSLHQQGYTSLEFAQTFLCVIFNTFKYNALIYKKKKKKKKGINFTFLSMVLWFDFGTVSTVSYFCFTFY